jgi:hypothetical protein
MKSSFEDFARNNIARQVPGAKQMGFFREWVEILWREYSEPPPPEDYKFSTKKEFFASHQKERPHFQPDMYYIDLEKRMIYFYEIEDTHPLTKDKLWRMERWFVDHGDEGGWHCRGIVTDRYGLNHRMVLAYEHSFGPEPYPEDEIEFRFPEVFRPLDPR